jgi:hypothetical protein
MIKMVTDGDINVSVCIDCARHESLKKVIKENTSIGLCGFCGRTDAMVRCLEDLQPMTRVFKALIRFYWHEFDYNRHFGGVDSIIDLFDDDDNLVVKPTVTDQYRDELDYLIQETVYPDEDKGISIYAGHNDGHRMANHAISNKSNNFTLSNISLKRAIQGFNGLLNDHKTEMESVIRKGEIWFRARIGFEKKIEPKSLDVWENWEVAYLPYKGEEIGSAPYPGDGRLNTKNEPVLYISSKPHTALAETRPEPGDYVSIGGFKVIRDLKILVFNQDIAHFSQNENRLDKYEAIYAYDQLISEPITKANKKSYKITQGFADEIKKLGYDGVQYRSAVSDGVNLCIFDVSSAIFEKGHSKSIFVKKVSYDFDEVRSSI